MTWRILRPFAYLALFVALVGYACGKDTSTPSPTTEPNNNNNTSTEAPVPTQKSNSSKGSGNLVQSLDDVQKATIQIVAEGTSVDPQQGTQLNAGWSGSGFFIDSSGLAVTNNHVVTGAAILKVYIGGDKTEYSARVVGVSECSDLAVIKVDATDFNYMKWYEGDLKTGMEVYAAGYPLGEPEFSLTKGIVSKTAADGQTSWASLKSVIGHDATINPGNSGGPLVTKDGEVVGVNYRGRASANQYFAIGANVAVPVVTELQTGMNVDSIGVNGEAISFGPNNEYPGIWVYSVESGSPADKSGVKAGDIILEMENILLASDGTFKEYCDVLRGHKSDETMSLRVYRPTTDEILEGQLNGKELANAGYGGLTNSGGNNSNNNNNNGSNGGNTDQTVTFNSGDVIVSTNFDDTTGWTYFTSPKSEKVTIKQRTGRVYIEVDDAFTEVYFLNDLNLTGDIHMTGNFKTVAGPNTNNISLVCRATDAGWYEFSVSSGGEWWIWKVDTAKSNPFTRLAHGFSKSIHLQKAENTIAGECFGEQLTLWANGDKIGEASDPDFSGGQFGVGIYADKVKGVGVEVSDFEAVVP
jgi:S1-C subfamily serine protease